MKKIIIAMASLLASVASAEVTKCSAENLETLAKYYKKQAGEITYIYSQSELAMSKEKDSQKRFQSYLKAQRPLIDAYLKRNESQTKIITELEKTHPECDFK